MTGWDLPKSLPVGGQEWEIRSDYRAILDILGWFNSPEYDDDEKWMICLDILYESFADMPQELWQDAAKAASRFIDAGIHPEDKNSPRLMDWEKDAPIIVPAVNSIMGGEVRAIPYMHWWTFLGYYMSIRESLFSEVLSIRYKKSKGKKLEKYETEFYRENTSLVDGFQKRGRSEADKQALNKLLGRK